jgi:phage baseplate assembly protein W
VDRPTSEELDVISLSIPFRLAGRKTFVTSRNYEEVVRGQVIDALMTNQGERVMRPRYGCDAQAAVFDPRDELVRQDAGGMIMTRLEQFVPRCIVMAVSIDLPPDSSVVNVNIVYRASPTSSDLTLEIPLSSEFMARQLAASTPTEV